ncbi:hypothetical protein GCM10027445_12440 [Amycolatopsis endophytica]
MAKVAFPSFRPYTRRLRVQVLRGPVPAHIGNQRWAGQQGFDDVGTAHRRGAEHIERPVA